MFSFFYRFLGCKFGAALFGLNPVLHQSGGILNTTIPYHTWWKSAGTVWRLLSECCRWLEVITLATSKAHHLRLFSRMESVVPDT